MIDYNRKNKTNLSGEIVKSLSQVSTPAKITVYMSPSCPHCKLAVHAANTLASQRESIEASIVDIEQFPRSVKKYSIQSVPVTIIDDRHIINKVVSETTLAQYIINRGTGENERIIFLSQINTGNIELAFKNVVDNIETINHFIYAWKTSTLSLRMGLFLLSEKIIDHDKQLFNTVVPDLIGIISSSDAALRGDTLDLLTQIGHKDAIEPIKKLLNDPDPDIAELAKEALDDLKGN